MKIKINQKPVEIQEFKGTLPIGVFQSADKNSNLIVVVTKGDAGHCYVFDETDHYDPILRMTNDDWGLMKKLDSLNIELESE